MCKTDWICGGFEILKNGETAESWSKADYHHID
jgi:hypothetical protein